MDKETFTLKGVAQYHPPIIKPVQQSSGVQGTRPPGQVEIAMPWLLLRAKDTAYRTAFLVRAGKSLRDHLGGKKQAKLCRFGVRNGSQTCPHSAAKSQGSLPTNLNLIRTHSS